MQPIRRRERALENIENSNARPTRKVPMLRESFLESFRVIATGEKTEHCGTKPDGSTSTPDVVRGVAVLGRGRRRVGPMSADIDVHVRVCILSQRFESKIDVRSGN